ncbi:universal stress protein [Pedobacter sp. Du54]|uniref:universal stress protein n=1 Tax=Pedobacter anseongensis TaxID=3133439 RepID=UPI0030AF92A5
MKKISAAFDGLKFSESTLAYSIALSKAAKAVLSGVFLESFLYHSYRLEGIIGKEGALQAKIKQHMREDKKIREHSHKLFEAACKKAKLMYSIHCDLGITMLEVIRESVYSDLMIVNNNDTFSTVEQPKPSLFIYELLSESKCPLLIVPKKYHKIENIIILYDGRPRAVNAIKMFHHLFPLMKNLPIEVISVSAVNKQSENPDKELMDEFIQCHYPQANTVELMGEPKELILNHIKHANLGSLIVMGANQRSWVSRFFNPSFAENVLENVNIPVFIVNS